MEYIKKQLSRNDILRALPNGNVAEIGVARGKYSASILKFNNPNKLYLIDIWAKIDLSYKDTNMPEQEIQESRFNDIKKIYHNNSAVEIIRKKSDEAAQLFENSFFDWVYIDADHSYQGCLRDLNCYDKLVKETGYILGHDFGNVIKRGYGVRKAVFEFIMKNNYFFTYLTLDEQKEIIISNKKILFKNGSFVISKNEQSHKILKKKLTALKNELDRI